LGVEPQSGPSRPDYSGGPEASLVLRERKGWGRTRVREKVGVVKKPDFAKRGISKL